MKDFLSKGFFYIYNINTCLHLAYCFFLLFLHDFNDCCRCCFFPQKIHFTFEIIPKHTVYTKTHEKGKSWQNILVHVLCFLFFFLSHPVRLPTARWQYGRAGDRKRCCIEQQRKIYRADTLSVTLAPCSTRSR